MSDLTDEAREAVTTGVGGSTNRNRYIGGLLSRLADRVEELEAGAPQVGLREEGVVDLMAALEASLTKARAIADTEEDDR